MSLIFKFKFSTKSKALVTRKWLWLSTNLGRDSDTLKLKYVQATKQGFSQLHYWNHFYNRVSTIGAASGTTFQMISFVSNLWKQFLNIFMWKNIMRVSNYFDHSFNNFFLKFWQMENKLFGYISGKHQY